MHNPQKMLQQYPADLERKTDQHFSMIDLQYANPFFGTSSRESTGSSYSCMGPGSSIVSSIVGILSNGGGS